MIFYHGTSNILNIKGTILPSTITKIRRGIWNNKYKDKVFFTPYLLLAKIYAIRACLRFGGKPIVYVVKPEGKYINKMKIIYIADKATIIEQVKEKNNDICI